MTLVQFAVGCAAAYFFVFGAAFVFRPSFAPMLGLKWENAAGKTEIRCYYGAVSWALCGFLIYLLTRHQSLDALTGVLFLATAVFVIWVLGTVIDGGWSDDYTKTAIPTEALFVLVVGLIRIRG